MSDNWNIPHRSRNMLTATSPSGATGMTGIRENLPDDEPLITYATDDLNRCLVVIADVRCPRMRYHDGPCVIQVLSETGVGYTIAAGQSRTSGEPGWLPDLTADIADLERRLATVAALHSGEEFGTGSDHAVRFCVECHQPAPCATARAATGVIDLEGANT